MKIKLFIAPMIGVVVAPYILSSSSASSKANASIEQKQENLHSLNKGLDILKKSITNFYNQNVDLLSNVSSPEEAYKLYEAHSLKKQIDIQYSYRDDFESAGWGFGYGKGYATGDGFIKTTGEMIGAGVDVSKTGVEIRPFLEAGLLMYLGTASAVPVIGLILAGAAAVLASSIIGAIALHRLGESPQREKGIVMTFFIVVYTGSWLQ